MQILARTNNKSLRHYLSYLISYPCWNLTHWLAQHCFRLLKINLRRIRTHHQRAEEGTWYRRASHVWVDPGSLNVRPSRSDVFGDCQHKATPIIQPIDGLDESLPEALAAHDAGAAVVPQGTRKHLRCACRSTIDPENERIGGRDQHLPAWRLEGKLDLVAIDDAGGNPAVKEQTGDLYGALEGPAGVGPDVQNEGVGPVLLEALDRALEGGLDEGVELVDADVANVGPVGPTLRDLE